MGLTPSAATSFPVRIAPAPTSHENQGVMVPTRVSGRVSPEKKTLVRNADPRRIALISGPVPQETKALARKLIRDG